MVRILFVCTGNTCRSPMAEALLTVMAGQAGLADKISIASAGVAVSGARPASDGARTIMRRRGLDLSRHRSRPLQPQMIAAADLILTMTAAHKQAVLALALTARDKVYTLAEYAGADGGIHDPFGGSVQEYEAVAVQIGDLLLKAWTKITVLAGK